MSLIVSNTKTDVSIMWAGKGLSRATASACPYLAKPGWWWINRVLVQPDTRRGKGVGGRLLEMLKKEVRKAGGTTLFVCPGGYEVDHKRQVGFYLKHGFAPADGGGYTCELHAPVHQGEGRSVPCVVHGDTNQLSERLLKDLSAFANFLEAESVEYRDHGNKETLVIGRRGKCFSISACGNRFDGGFFGYKEGDCP